MPAKLGAHAGCYTCVFLGNFPFESKNILRQPVFLEIIAVCRTRDLKVSKLKFSATVLRLRYRVIHEDMASLFFIDTCWSIFR